MTSEKEINEIFEFFKRKKRLKNLVLYSCVSAYPAEIQDVSLLDIKKLIKQYGKYIKAIGFSGHHLGIAVDVAAYTLGAEWIERHFTLDRTWKGTDHSASLEPTGLRKLSRDLKATHKALTFKQSDILNIEKVQREKLKFRKQ